MASAFSAALVACLLAGCSGDDPATPCAPECAGRACGEGDGCGGTCEAACCVPDCAGRACGDDGCGGACGECPADATCAPGGACVAPACPAGLSCVEEAHLAHLYACTRAASGLPWAWDCVRGAVLGWFPSAAECDMACTGGESACHAADSQHGAECRACLGSCALAVEYACAAETGGSCPGPCACR